MNFFFPNMYTFFEYTTLYQFFFLNYWLFLNLDTFFFGIIDDDDDDDDDDELLLWYGWPTKGI